MSFHMYKVERTSHIGMCTGVNMIVLMYKMEKIPSLRYERIFKTCFRCQLHERVFTYMRLCVHSSRYLCVYMHVCGYALCIWVRRVCVNRDILMCLKL